jgi:hypothetical protein
MAAEAGERVGWVELKSLVLYNSFNTLWLSKKCDQMGSLKHEKFRNVGILLKL